VHEGSSLSAGALQLAQCVLVFTRSMQIRWHSCWLLALAVSACTLNPQPELPVAPAAPSDNPGSAGSRNGVGAPTSAAGSAGAAAVPGGPIVSPGAGGASAAGDGANGEAGAVGAEAGASGEAGASAGQLAPGPTR